jgi:O-antigen ligase
MMADKPWFGFGWNQPERVYSPFYRPAKVDEGMAIQLNDYFMLGMTLGIPALVCFVTYVGLSLAAKSRTPGGTLNLEPRTSNLEPGPSQGGEIGDSDFGVRTSDLLPVVCRAGAAVLLVGFWFDGGLFKLATGATFWILLELGRAGDHEIREIHENG